MVLVEGSQRRGHLLVALPSFGDHHQDCVRERPAAEVQELEDLVEGGGVARPRRHDGKDALDRPGQKSALEKRLARLHPVPVAPDGVDLSVVGDEAEGVSERPGGEGVGREAGVDEAKACLETGVGQVPEDASQLARGQHPFVDEGPRGERGEVEAGELVLGPLAEHEEQPLEVERIPRPFSPGAAEGARNTCSNRGATARAPAPARPSSTGIRRQASTRRPSVAARCSKAAFVRAASVSSRRQEGHPAPVAARGRKIDPVPPKDVTEETVGHLHEDAGAVTGLGVGSEGPPMGEVLERRQPELHDPVAGRAGHVGDEGDPAGVVLVGGVVETRLLISCHGVLVSAAGRRRRKKFRRDVLGPLKEREYTREACSFSDHRRATALRGGAGRAPAGWSARAVADRSAGGAAPAGLAGVASPVGREPIQARKWSPLIGTARW